MKKGVVFAVLFVLLLSLSVSAFSFADFFAKFFGGEGLTGSAVSIFQEGSVATLIIEKITCNFADSTTEQKCYGNGGQFSCTGTGSCTVEVSGEQSKSIEWKSSCDGIPSTTLDGSDETITFKCPVPATPAPAPPLTPIEAIKEVVQCTFYQSNTEQKCYTSDGQFSCAGTSSCSVVVSGEKGKSQEWKSSCGGTFYTTLDGADDSLAFKCPVLATPVPSPTPSPTPNPIETVKEQVRCIFTNANTYQKCYTGDGKYVCAGIGSCINEVLGENGAKLSWKSSCGGYGYTLIDGSNENVEFSCLPTTSPIPSPTPVPVPPPVPEFVQEQVRCVFANSVTEQKCYSDNGNGCSGSGTCIVDVSGTRGKTLTWKSSCSGYASTTLDGNNKYAEFKCAQTSISPTPLPTQPVKEQVKCIFASSAGEQKCYTDDGKFGCSGTGSCVTNIFSSPGAKLTWKSTCGGYAYTIAGGGLSYAEFNCGAASVAPGPIEMAKEQVKCIFAHSNSEQKCGASYEGKTLECSGIGTCVLDIYGAKGKMLTWKSTCGGYAYTVIDEKNEYAEFDCSKISTQPWPQTTFSRPPENLPVQICTDSDGLNYFFKGYVESGIDTFRHKDYDTCRVINSNTDYYDTNECSGGNCYVLESSCTSSQTAQAQVWKCSNKCQDGACERGIVKEQVKCIFSDPEYIQRCYADSGKLGCQDLERKCYTENGAFACSEITVASEPLVGGGFKYTPFCVAEVSGELGEKLTWKSSCGGYFYTVMDGHNEDVELSCVPSSNVSFGQISGKGFLHASWQCYDGTEEESIEGVDLTTCKSSEIWQQYAQESCKSRCYSDGSKCGVNSFSVSRECYIDVEKEGVFISLPEGQAETERMTDEEKKIREQKRGKEVERKVKEKPKETEEISLICKDSCPLDGKCYPFGYRKEGKFCTDNGAFAEQLSGDTGCDNNFECQSNVCVSGKCISSGLMNKIMGWFKNLFGGKETEEAKKEVIDCGASSECMENAFKECKPAKMIQPGGGPVSEIVIVGLEDEKCVLKMSAGSESMTCKFENYARGLKDIGSSSSGSIEEYCSGSLTYWLSSAPKMAKPAVLNSVVKAIKLSADANDRRYSFTVHDPEGIKEFSIVKSNFGEVLVKAEPPCAKEFTSELEFEPSDLPFRASVVDCGTQITRQELDVEMGIPIAEQRIELNRE